MRRRFGEAMLATIAAGSRVHIIGSARRGSYFVGPVSTAIAKVEKSWIPII
jgi:hypothetical protein